MNPPCQLCGYRSSRGRNVSPQCPVCGQEHANENKADDGVERTAEPDAKGLLNVVRSAAGTKGSAKWRMGKTMTTQGTISLELQSLLQRLPQQSDFRRKEHELLSAAGVVATGHGAENRGDNFDPNVIYIRSRADPTMRVLKGRYKAQPRMRRAASMSALHRLADPLTGYDSMEALTPKARKRRQENVQRILETGKTGGTTNGASGSDPRLVTKSISAELRLDGKATTLLRHYVWPAVDETLIPTPCALPDENVSSSYSPMGKILSPWPCTTSGQHDPPPEGRIDNCRLPESQSSFRGRFTKRSCSSTVRRRSTARSSTTSVAVRTPMAISVDAVHSQRRTSAAAYASRSANKLFEPPAGKSWGSNRQNAGVSARVEEIWNRGCGTRHWSAVFGQLGVGKTPKTRVQFRRKRVATMRSVNGWVRESDPASTRRRESLEKRVLSLGKVVGGRIASKSCLGRGPSGDCHTRQENKNNTFLTAVDTEHVTLQGSADEPESDGREICDGLTRYNGRGRRIPGTESCRVPAVDGKRLARRGKRRGRQNADAHKLGRRQSIFEARGRHTIGTSPARDRTNVGLGRGRGYTSSVALNRSDLRGVRRRVFRSPSVGSVSQSGCRGSPHQDVADLLSSTRDAAVSPGVVVQGLQWNVCKDDRRAPRHKRWMERRESNKAKAVDILLSSFGPATITSQMLTPARMADTRHSDELIAGVAPAWGVQDSNTARPSSTEHGISRYSAENTEVEERPLNAWQDLRGVGASTVQSVVTLQHFEEKVAGAETRKVVEPSQSLKQQRLGDTQSVHQSDRREARPLPSDRRPPYSGSRPGSRGASIPECWIHRRCLPSLLTTRTSSSSRGTTPVPIGRTTTATPNQMISRRAKRRPVNGINDKYIGRMQRLDKAPKTVGDALDGDIGQLRSWTMIADPTPGDDVDDVTAQVRTTTKVDMATHPRKNSRQQPCLTRGLALGGGERKGGWGCGISSAISKPSLYIGSVDRLTISTC